MVATYLNGQEQQVYAMYFVNEVSFCHCEILSSRAGLKAL